MDFCNGKAAMREAIINVLMDKKTKVRGAAHLTITEIIKLVENLEVV
jgi:hypothetical protein